MENLSPLLQATINKSNDATNAPKISQNSQETLKNVIIEDKFTPSTRFTKKGNHYEKTNIAKWTGLGAGALYGTIKLIKDKKIINEVFTQLETITKELIGGIAERIPAEKYAYLNEDTINSIKQVIPPTYIDGIKNINDQNISNYVKVTKITTAAAYVGCALLVGFTLGAIINGIVNKIKAHKADKAAALKE